MSEPKKLPNIPAKQIPGDEFHLGITMAGAVSAGSYTGGVMDYLFEVLDLWERAKKGELDGVDPKYVPNHKVVIDAIGGASAGGMTTAMAAVYALNGDIVPVKDADPERMAEKKNNIFYDSWVLLDDLNEQDPRSTFQKIWDRDDLKSGRIRSALNSKAIDSIADRAFLAQGELRQRVEELPSYISKDLELLLSHTVLRGIPLTVPFYQRPGNQQSKDQIVNDADPGHTSFDHFLIAHYKLNKGEPVHPDQYLQLDPYSTQGAAYLKLSAKATGAFPIGLVFRKFPDDHFSKGYIHTLMRRVIFRHFGHADPIPEKPIKLTDLAAPYSTITVDGGAMNNEPYAEVLGVLRDRYIATSDQSKLTTVDENGAKTKRTPQPAFGVVMIDPFPDRPKDPKDYKEPKDVFDVAPQLISTLWDQSKVKRNEMIEQFESDHFRGQVYPVKRKMLNTKEKEPYPIACGSVAAFGGFLDIRFRHHDFFLGRNNARNFIRAYLSLPYHKDAVHPIHQGWSEEMIERFKIRLEGVDYLPIIPDMNILLHGIGDPRNDRFQYDVPNKPSYDPRNLAQAIPAMEARVERLLVVASERIGKEDQEATGEQEEREDTTSTIADQWMRRLYRDNLWKRFMGWAGRIFVGLIFGASKGTAAKRIVKVLVAWVLADLEKFGLLNGPNEPTKDNAEFSKELQS